MVYLTYVIGVYVYIPASLCEGSVLYTCHHHKILFNSRWWTTTMETMQWFTLVAAGFFEAIQLSSNLSRLHSSSIPSSPDS